jgi:hypothetical protein
MRTETGAHNIMLHLTDDVPDEKFEAVLHKLDALIHEQAENPLPPPQGEVFERATQEK